MDKEFNSLEEQIEKLKKRGLGILDEDYAKRILEKENYYNLINGYKELFIDKSNQSSDETYIKGTNFTEIYALYLFDRELRSLFIRNILEIENNVKSVVAYCFSKNYGHENYLKITNFNTTINNWEQNKTQSQKVGEVAELIANLHREISNQLRKNNPMISHNVLTYGYVPLWVLVNTLSLGTVSTFYSYLIQKDQNDIGRRFNLKPEQLSKFLFILAIFRNACAHDERLFNLKSRKKDMSPNSIKTSGIHRQLGIPFNSSNNPTCGKNDLFAIVIIFKLMLPKESFNVFINRIKSLVDHLESELAVITIKNVLEKMGFPENWEDISNI